MSARPDAQHRRRDATPAPEAPSSSWWAGNLSRAEFIKRQADQQPRMAGLATPYHRTTNLSAAADARTPPTAYPERTPYWEDV